MFDSWWDTIRALNIAAAMTAIFLNETKSTRLKFKDKMPLDAFLGFHMLLGFCAAIILASGWAWMEEVEAGPWTLIITGPLLGTVLVGCLGRKPKVVDNAQEAEA